MLQKSYKNVVIIILNISSAVSWRQNFFYSSPIKNSKATGWNDSEAFCT